MRFWPVQEAAQADYERLRSAVLAGMPLIGPVAERFERGGLRALITRPTAPPYLIATLLGVPRPRWSPYKDPRLDTLVEAYRFLTDEPARIRLELAE